MTNLGGWRTGQEQESPASTMYSMNKSTQPIETGTSHCPTLTVQPTKPIPAFLIAGQSLSMVAFFLWQLLQYFSQIQLESLTDVPAHSQASWSFLLRTPPPLAYECVSISGPICPGTCSQHQPNLLTSTLPHTVPPIKAWSSFTMALSAQQILIALYKVNNP